MVVYSSKKRVRILEVFKLRETVSTHLRRYPADRVSVKILISPKLVPLNPDTNASFANLSDMAVFLFNAHHT